MSDLLLAILAGTIACIVGATMASMAGADGALLVGIGVACGFVGMLATAALLSRGSS